jgi:hypothetical protein
MLVRKFLCMHLSKKKMLLDWVSFFSSLYKLYLRFLLFIKFGYHICVSDKHNEGLADLFRVSLSMCYALTTPPPPPHPHPRCFFKIVNYSFVSGWNSDL